MGFYFRKSKSFGPFRLNLSKSGLGLSTGIKGARLSFGPRGTYVNMGSGGLYYRKKLGGKKRSAKRGNIYNQTKKTQYNEQTSEINIREESLLESFEETALFDDIKKAKNFRTLFITLAIVLFALSCAMPIFVIPLYVLAILSIVFKRIFKATINYELDSSAQSAWDDFIKSLLLFKNSKKIWLVESSTTVYNRKINAGAASTVKRSAIKNVKCILPNKANIFKIKSNNTAFQIVSDKVSILLLPSLIIVKKGRKCYGYSYGTVDISASSTPFIEAVSTVPKDAEIIRWTYQYVNKNGGPDMRYSNNPKLPVCNYGVFSISTENGTQIQLYTSNLNVPKIIEHSFRQYCSYFNQLINHSSTDAIQEPNTDSSEIVKEKSGVINSSLVDDIHKYILFEGESE